jgi:hypothetical protein
VLKGVINARIMVEAVFFLFFTAIRETGEKSKTQTQRRGAIKRELKNKTKRVKRYVSVLSSESSDTQEIYSKISSSFELLTHDPTLLIHLSNFREKISN